MINSKNNARLRGMNKMIGGNPQSNLSHFLQKELLGALTATAVLHGAGLAHTYSGQHIHTRSAAFLRNCMGQSPATVASINSGCPNREKGLIGIGSSVIRLQTVQRHLSGQKGLWYLVRVIQNQTSNQAASNQAPAGSIGWLRANKF